MGWNAIKNWANSMAERHPWALFEAAKANDTAKLEVHRLITDASSMPVTCMCFTKQSRHMTAFAHSQDLLARLPGQVQGPPTNFRNQYLEYEDIATG